MDLEQSKSTMLDAVQSAAVITANAFVPGSGALVNASFELGKVVYQIAEVLVGLREKAAVIKAQFKLIAEDVDDFQYVLELLKRVHNQTQLTEKLQQTILEFYEQVQEYDRVVVKFTTRSLIKQLMFRSEMADVSAAAKRTSSKVLNRLTAESAIDASHTYGSTRVLHSIEDRRVEQEKRCLAIVDSPEIMEELSHADKQKDVLATITTMGRRDEMQGKSSAQDPVLRVIKQKVWASSSAAVRNEISNLPSWYLAENEIDSVEATKLGFGGDAKVYRAKHTGESVAIKIYDGNSTRDETTKQRFIDTMNLWQRLQHAHLCRFYGACYLVEKPFAVMELCDGGSLETFLRRDESTRPHAALEMLVHAAQGMLKMHSLGIVHCDFKADNIVIDIVSGKAKVCDFDRSFDWTALKTKRLTNGTAKAAGVEISDAVRWLAPECLEGKVPSSASDVYSFGMTIYQALTGESPYFDINQDEEVKACILSHELPARDIQRISDGAWKLISQCCAPAPEQRPTMADVLNSLRALSLASRRSASEVESQVDALMDIASTVDRAGVTVVRGGNPSPDAKPPNDYTPVKAVKPQSRFNAKSRKMAVLGLLVLAILGVAGGVIGSYVSSSASKSPTPTSTSAAPTPTSTTPAPTTIAPTPTPVYLQVATIVGGGSAHPFAFVNLAPGVVVASDGYIYLSDMHRILRLKDGGDVSVYSGSSTKGIINGPLASATYWTPRGVALSSSGDLYICDWDNSAIRKITGGSTVSTWVSTANLYPQAIAIDSSGVAYVTRPAAHSVMKITSAGVSSTLTSSLDAPEGIALDAAGNVYISDRDTIKSISPDGTVTVLAGSTTTGFANGIGTAAQFNSPYALTFGVDGNLYIADTGNNCIRKLALATNAVTTYAGVCGSTGSMDGIATVAQFDTPVAIAVTSSGVMYVVDGNTATLRKIYYAPL